MNLRSFYIIFKQFYSVTITKKMSCVASDSNFSPESVYIDSKCPKCAQAIGAATCHLKCQIRGPLAKIRMFSKSNSSLGGWLPNSGKFLARKPSSYREANIVEQCCGITDPGRIRTVPSHISLDY